jgi:hypothetical protein
LSKRFRNEKPTSVLGDHEEEKEVLEIFFGKSIF